MKKPTAEELKTIREGAEEAISQAKDVSIKMGFAWKEVNLPEDVVGLDRGIMSAYRQLEAVKSNGDRIVWERYKGNNQREGDGILFQFDDLLKQLHPKEM